MKTTLDILTAARALLTPEGAWCKGAFARAADHSQVVAGTPAARSFCLMGAGLHAIRRSDLTQTEQDAAYQRMQRALRGAHESLCNGPRIIDWNDDPARTHADVLVLLDRTIEAERTREEEDAP